MRRSTRRDFLAQSALALSSVPLIGRGVAAWQPTDASTVFKHGVASGDPLADRVMLWTRVTSAQRDATDVSWSLATDPGMTRIVARGQGRTGAERDFTVKVDVTGLAPATTYYYRFECEGSQSRVGRTRTVPRGNTSRLRSGRRVVFEPAVRLFQCLRGAGGAADLDAVLHLGDYLYEYANGGFGDGTKLGRVPSPDREIVTLADYRQRHAQYKADLDLQEVHRQHPFIVVWDDHELTNNTWWGGAQNHNPENREGEWYVRRDAAVRAFFEWMPIREDAAALSPRIYRTLTFGDLADLMLLDTRLVGRDLQVERDNIAAVHASDRSLIGAAQEGWLRGELSESKRANRRWQILGQQVMFAPQTPVNQRAGNPDSWDGYRASRARVFDMVEQLKVENFAVLTGDVHSSWAFDLPRDPFGGYDAKTGKGSLGVEFAGTSVTSTSNVGAGPDGEKALADLRAARPHLHYVDGRYRGYYIVDVTHERLQADYFAVRTIEERTTDEKFVKGFAAPIGQMHLTEQQTPAAPAANAPAPAP